MKGVKPKKFFNNLKTRKQVWKPWVKPQWKKHQIINLRPSAPKGKLYRQNSLISLKLSRKRNYKNPLNRVVLSYANWQKLKNRRKTSSLRRKRRWLSSKRLDQFNWNSILTAAVREVVPTVSKNTSINKVYKGVTSPFGLVWPGRRNRRIWFGAYRSSLKWKKSYGHLYRKKWYRNEAPIWALKRLADSNSLVATNNSINIFKAMNKKRVAYRATKIYWRWINKADTSKTELRLQRNFDHLKEAAGDFQIENEESYNPIYDEDLDFTKIDKLKNFDEVNRRLALEKRHRFMVRKHWSGQKRIAKQIDDIHWDMQGPLQLAHHLTNLSKVLALKKHKLVHKWKLRHSFNRWLNKKASWRKRVSMFKKRRWFNRRRHGEKFDPEVSLVWRNGVETRCITKFGNRKIYRPVKRKFPKWWKLPMGNKSMKRRRRNKKIFAFRWLNRTRHHMLSRVIRRRKFYSRRKRLNDFMYWKLNSPVRLLNYAFKRHESANDILQQLVPLRISMKSPQFAVRRSHRINILANLWRYRQHKWFARGRTRLAKVRVSNVQPIVPLSKATPKSVSFINLPQIKRYRRRYRSTIFQRDKRVGFNKVSTKPIEKSLTAWRSAGIEYKNRLHIFGTKHFSSFWKRGI